MTERDVVEQHQVLMDLPHVSNVGYNRLAESLGEQADGEKLANASKANDIRLNEVNGVRLEQLLEDDAIGDVSTGCQPGRGDLPRDERMTEDVVGVSRLRNPVRIHLSEVAAD